MPLTISASIFDQAGATQAPVVLGLEGEEALDEDFHYRLTCAFTTAPTLADMLGAKVGLHLVHGPSGSSQARWLGAHITAWEVIGDLVLNCTTYHACCATLEPALARLGHDLGSEVWAGQSALAVAKDMLAGGDGTGTTQHPALAVHSYAGFVNDRPLRQQVVRWRESTTALVRRLLAEEGIHTWYAHPKHPHGSHVLVLSERNNNASVPDKAEKGAADALTSVISDVVSSRDGAENRRIWSWRQATQEGPSSVELNDRDYRVFPWTNHPDGSGTASLTISQIGNPKAVPRGVWRENLGLADLADMAAFKPVDTDLTFPNWMATRRAEERLCRQRTVCGEGDHFGLHAGCLFSFAGTNDRFLATRVRIAVHCAPQCQAGAHLAKAESGLRSILLSLAEAQVQQRVNSDLAAALGAPSPVEGIELSWNTTSLVGKVEVEAIPETIPWRPARHRAQQLAGIHPATVVGATANAKDGSLDISKDGLGQVLVRLDWASKPTARIRVVQGAGGLLAVPRVGDRVAISFVQGDANRPLVVGTLYDKVATAPAQANDANGLGRTVLRSRFAGDQGFDVATPRQGRLGDLKAWDKDGKGFLATKDRGAGDNADTFGYSEIALDDRDSAGGSRGIDLFSAGGMREQISGDRTIKVGKKLIIEAGEMIELRVGDSKLVLLPGATQLGYINPTFPAMGSHITCTHSRIEATSLALNLTGWCEASMSTAAAAFEASMTNAKVTGMCAQLNSDLVGRLCKLASFFFQTFGSAADPTCRVESEKAADIAMFIVKEVLLNVLSLKDVAKYAGRCKGDVIGSSTVASTLGMATVSADPFSAAVSALDGLGLLADIAGSFGSERKGGVAGGLATAGTAGAIIAAIVYRKELGEAISDFKSGGAGGALGKAGKAIKDLVTPPDLNVLRIGSVSGVLIHGVQYEQLVMRKDTSALVNSERAAEKNKTTLHNDKVGGAVEEIEMQEMESSITSEEGNVSGNKLGAASTDNNILTEGSNVVDSDVGVAGVVRAVLQSDGTVVSMRVPL